MSRLKLVVPTKEYESQVMTIKAEMLENNDDFDGCAGLEKVSSYAEWLDLDTWLTKMYGEDHSPSDVYLAVRISDNRVVGIIDFRHRLSEFLLNFGGNIGYSIRPADRRNGYATEMLGLLLEKCREFGAEKVLITCDKDNIASAKTIIRNGGVLENEVEDTVGLIKSGDGIIQRYWINL